MSFFNAGRLADADQILAEGEPDFDRLVVMVREAREGLGDRTKTLLLVVNWLNRPEWEHDMLVSHLALAMVRLAEREVKA